MFRCLFSHFSLLNAVQFPFRAITNKTRQKTSHIDNKYKQHDVYTANTLKVLKVLKSFWVF